MRLSIVIGILLIMVGANSIWGFKGLAFGTGLALLFIAILNRMEEIK